MYHTVRLPFCDKLDRITGSIYTALRMTQVQKQVRNLILRIFPLAENEQLTRATICRTTIGCLRFKPNETQQRSIQLLWGGSDFRLPVFRGKPASSVVRRKHCTRRSCTRRIFHLSVVISDFTLVHLQDNFITSKLRIFTRKINVYYCLFCHKS